MGALSLHSDIQEARDYNPSLGRFISRDPIGLGGLDTNFYRYVKNSPIDYIDPDGLLTQKELRLINQVNTLKQRLKYLEKQLDLKNKPVESLSLIEKCFLTNLSITSLLREIREKQVKLKKLQKRLKNELEKNDISCPIDRDKDVINLGDLGVFGYGGTDCEKERDFWESPLN